MLIGMGTEQIAVRVPEALLGELDNLVRSGRYASRAAAVRAGIEEIAQQAREGAVDRAIVEGYRRKPQQGWEKDSARASMLAAIAEEPW